MCLVERLPNRHSFKFDPPEPCKLGGGVNLYSQSRQEDLKFKVILSDPVKGQIELLETMSKR